MPIIFITFALAKLILVKKIGELLKRMIKAVSGMLSRKRKYHSIDDVFYRLRVYW